MIGAEALCARLFSWDIFLSGSLLVDLLLYAWRVFDFAMVLAEIQV